MNEGKYNIKAVSNLVGIQPGTLRAWERRYQILEPVRNDSGHRLYTEDDVKKLKWLSAKVNQGFTISQAVSLLDKHELETDQLTSEDKGENHQILLEELLQALMQFNEVKAHDLINKAFSLFTIDKVTVEILAVLLLRVGDMWEKGEITTAHEHFATSILRSRIGMIMHSFPHNGVLPKVVAVCGPNEWHELGLLIFTLFVRRRGYEVIYLGSSIKQGDLEVVLDTVDPKFLFLSCTLKENLFNTLELVERLREAYPGLEIGMGGAAVNSLDIELTGKYEQHIVGQSQKNWEEWLNKRL
ncbi:DNA-binding transcriptional MerR regulator [Bacillus ectoiniformans]|uniref:MerR family transcriptional regulator n=1 Tax=Bacillus ectoiniformans TaxID=1494429 RepID=UPI00195A30AD|nr:MerR family transcriptional regulator [Bacillus ectoiniformans]MBM7648016.1 DNA-binding transcriptional MerR regulator [Bacillus ectoiniformans]